MKLSGMGMRLFCSFKYRNGKIAEYLQIGGDDDMDWALCGQFGSEYLWRLGHQQTR